MQKIYHDPKINFTIVDVSGVKPFEKIKEEFSDRGIDFDSIQTIDINEKEETFDVSDGSLKKKLK